MALFISIEPVIRYTDRFFEREVVKLPKAVRVTYQAFLELKKELLRMGFAPISRTEVGRAMVNWDLKPPHMVKIPGEIGFKYSENGLTVKVWTSCVRSLVEACEREAEISAHCSVGRPPGGDSGWVLIERLGREQYFARPTNRTKNFVRTLLQRAWITQWKVQHRPLCPACNKFMSIFSRGNGAVFWCCLRTGLHDDTKPRWANWDAGLPPKALRISKAWRREFHRYLKKKREEGEEPRRASAVRTGWHAGRDPS